MSKYTNAQIAARTGKCPACDMDTITSEWHQRPDDIKHLVEVRCMSCGWSWPETTGEVAA